MIYKTSNMDNFNGFLGNMFETVLCGNQWVLRLYYGFNLLLLLLLKGMYL